MKTKKWYSALLAFALLATGCSNEIDPDDGKGGNGGDIAATMKVFIQTDNGTSTKAAEDGDMSDGEAGSIEESNVKNISVFLFEKGSGDDDLTKLSDLKSRNIVAHGYATNTATSASGSGNHTWEATVDIKMNTSASLQGNTYGVIAVVNAGDITDGSYSTVGDLANKIQSDYQTADGFVMSTHQLKGDANTTSTVVFPAAGVTTPPTTTVYVERLAAKVRINKSSDYTFTPKTATDDKVELTSALVFNQLSSGSYLLKRVSGSKEKDLTSAVDNDVLLSDEAYVTSTSSVADNIANFVIDPWTRTKVATAPTDLNYKHPLCEGKIGKLVTSSAADIVNLDANKGNQHLAYTMENTTTVAYSTYGYSTGVLFEGKYTPKQVYKIDSDNKNVSLVNFETSDNNFYVYNKLKFISVEAIFAYTLAHQSATTSSDYFYYSDFLDTSTKTVAEYKASKTYKSSTIDDVFGYMKKLDDAVESEEDNSKLIKNVLNDFVDYIGNGGTGYADRFKNIDPYEDCKCYYLYWIRHENNNENTLVGPMEFAIVRNNLYDLTIEGVNGLGLSSEYKPDSSTPDESIISQIEVTVKVKNWVVRKNSNIIL